MKVDRYLDYCGIITTEYKSTTKAKRAICISMFLVRGSQLLRIVSREQLSNREKKG